MSKLQPVRGTRDILPAEMRAHRHIETTGETVAERAKSHGLWSRRVDGADPVGSYRAIARACELARKGDGPALVEAVVAQLAHDPPAHRDPVERLRRRLDTDGVWTRTFQDVIEAEVRGQLDSAVQQWEGAQA